MTEKGYSVGGMEMGRRWKAEDFPKSNWDSRRWIWRPGLRMFGFYNMRLFRHMMVLCGNAVGGGCGLPTAMHAIELAQIKLGDRVLIQGSGPVGLSACALALPYPALRLVWALGATPGLSRPEPPPPAAPGGAAPCPDARRWRRPPPRPARR